MTKLNQLIAISKTTKNASNDKITEVYKQIQKGDLFSGISRTYDKKEEEGDDYPSESTLVILNVDQLIDMTEEVWTRLIDVEATKDNSNCNAKADIVVDGQTIVSQVPVTTLIWLEKQLVDFKTFISKLPALDPAFSWTPDDNAGAGIFASAPMQTNKTKKIPRAFVKAEATVQHPAQVDVYQEDVIVGVWNTIKFSGAWPQARIDAALRQVTALQDATKYAREQANSIDVADMKIGETIFNFLLGE